MSKAELERKWRVQKLMEQEEMLLMEAKARALQYIVSSGGSMIDNENPQILDVDMGAVLFFDGTWKYLYLDYKNGTISEPIDTLVTREYLYYMRDLGGPIQDKGLVYVLSDTKDPYNTGSSFNLSVIYIGINGELVDTRYFHIDPDGISDYLLYCDGDAHIGIKNDGQKTTAIIFNGYKTTEKEYTIKPGYEFMTSFTGAGQNNVVDGKILLYHVYLIDYNPAFVDIISIDVSTMEDNIIISENIFILGEPNILGYYPGNMIYFTFTIDGYFTRLRGYDINTGDLVFDFDPIQSIPGTITGNPDFIFYGKNNLQIIFGYLHESIPRKRIYNFIGGSKNVITQDIDNTPGYSIITRRSTFDPYSLNSYTESNGIVNIFYTGQTSTPLTVPDLCTVYYLMDGESQYRTYVVRGAGDPERSINLSQAGNFFKPGKDLYIESDMGNLEGLSGTLSIIYLGETINIIDIEEQVGNGDSPIVLLPSGHNSLYLIPIVGGEYKVLLLGPEGSLIEQFNIYPELIGISGPSIFLNDSVSGISYYYNEVSSGFSQLNGFKATTSQYMTSDRSQDGNLIIYDYS